MAAAEVQIQALMHALQVLTSQVQAMAEHGAERVSSGGKKWDSLDRYKNLTVFDGNQKNFEEWSVKFRSLVKSGDVKVGRLMEAVEDSCTEERLALNKFNELEPAWDESDEQFVAQSAAEMYNVLLNTTTGEANAVVRRSLGMGWLAWKRLVSSLNPRTLASGIKAISGVLNPAKITNAAKADAMLDEWDDKLAKLRTEYSQDLTSKMKVAVLYSMLPKDLQEKVLDACSVSWDGTTESDATDLYAKVKAQVKNFAKARREMQGPKPMEVDMISNKWADWSNDDWADQWGKPEQTESTNGEDKDDAYVQFVGKGYGKKGGGKGFQGHCYVCGEFGHSQWDCKGKGKGIKGGYDGHAGKGFGKDGSYTKGYGKAFGKGYYNFQGKGKGSDGKGTMPRACFGCGSTEHLLRDCPKNPAKIQQVEDKPEEVLFIGQVKEDWKTVPMKVRLGDFVKAPIVKSSLKTQFGQNKFKVLEEDEPDEEEVHVQAVECVSEQGCDDIGYGTRVKGGKAGAFGPVEVYRGTRPGARTSVPLASTHAYTDPQPGTRDIVGMEGKETLVGQDFFASNTPSEAKKSCLYTEGQIKMNNMEEAMNKMKDEVSYVQAVGNQEEMMDLGMGDIVVDSAADESCWPVGHGDAFPTRKSTRTLRLKTANGADMNHYGEKEVTFKYKGGEGKEAVGIKFQVTDVRKPLLAVRRLVEKGCTVTLAGGDGESFIKNKETGVRIPVVKKGGSFVIEARFVKKMMKEGFQRQA
jgi:hypothetical protein